MYTKKGVIASIATNAATISLEDNQIIKWETTNLPPNLKIGDPIILELKNKQMQEQNQQELAQNILHEIFKTTPQEKIQV